MSHNTNETDYNSSRYGIDDRQAMMLAIPVEQASCFDIWVLALPAAKGSHRSRHRPCVKLNMSDARRLPRLAYLHAMANNTVHKETGVHSVAPVPKIVVQS